MNGQIKEEKYDAIIIGFGKGGKTLAGYLGNSGKKVAVIEKSDKMYGGTCINVACIPSKSLVKSAKLVWEKQLETMDEKAKAYKLAIEERASLTSMLRAKNFDKLNTNENITIYTGMGSFVSEKHVKVVMKDQTILLQADKIFINTGSTPNIPDIKGIENNNKVYTSKSIMELYKLPKRLAIIGAGNIGLEFASMYANFGSKVTVFVRGRDILSSEDQEISSEIKKVLVEKDIEFKTSAQVESVEEKEEQIIISYLNKDSGKRQQYTADALLVATGRMPNIEGLNLQAAKVDVTADGAIKVDEYLRTTTENIWAIGDVKGGPQTTYLSLDDYRIIQSQLGSDQDKKSLKDRINVPYSIFIDPAYSKVGFNEKEAKEQGYQIKIAKMSASAIPKAQVLQEQKGILKVVIDDKTDRILGAMLFCAESYEIINIITLAMDTKQPYTYLRDQIFTHPTMSESLNDLFHTVE